MTSSTPKMVYVKKISNYRLLPPKSDRAWMRKLPGHWPDSTTGHQVTIRQFHLDDGDYFMMRPQKTPGKDDGPNFDRYGSLSNHSKMNTIMDKSHLVLGPLNEDDSPWYVMLERKATLMLSFEDERHFINQAELLEKELKRELLGGQFSAEIENGLKIKYILMRQDRRGCVDKGYVLMPLTRGDLACAQPGIMAEADRLAYLAHQGLQLTADSKDKPANYIMLQKMSFRDIIPRDALEWHRRNLAGYSLMLALALQLKPLHDANILHNNIGPRTVFRDLETGWPRLGGFGYSCDLNKKINKKDFCNHHFNYDFSDTMHNSIFQAPEFSPGFVIHKKPLCGSLCAPH